MVGGSISWYSKAGMRLNNQEWRRFRKHTPQEKRKMRHLSHRAGLLEEGREFGQIQSVVSSHQKQSSLEWKCLSCRGLFSWVSIKRVCVQLLTIAGSLFFSFLSYPQHPPIGRGVEKEGGGKWKCLKLINKVGIGFLLPIVATLSQAWAITAAQPGFTGLTCQLNVLPQLL